MENLIKKLQEEVGLSNDQAIKSLSIIKDFLDKEGLEIDWEKFFKGKYESFKSQVMDIYNDASKRGDAYTDKIADVADDFADKARQGVQDLSRKVSDFFDDKK